MGENIEYGAREAIKAGMETVVINAGIEDIAERFDKETAQQFIDEESPTGISLPQLNGSFHVSGLSAILKDNETMRNIREVIVPLMSEGHPMAKYIKPYSRD